MTQIQAAVWAGDFIQQVEQVTNDRTGHDRARKHLKTKLTKGQTRGSCEWLSRGQEQEGRQMSNRHDVFRVVLGRTEGSSKESGQVVTMQQYYVAG